MPHNVTNLQKQHERLTDEQANNQDKCKNFWLHQCLTSTYGKDVKNSINNITSETTNMHNHWPYY